MLSPFKGSGHAGNKSPRKNRVIDALEFHTAKLRSPMKRSMAELNKIAYKNALKNKTAVSEEFDDISLNEKSIIEEIIMLSQEDGFNTLELEEEDDEEDLTGLENLRKGKHRSPKVRPQPESFSLNIPLLEHEQREGTISPKKDAISVKKEMPETPTDSPLRKSTRSKIPASDPFNTYESPSRPKRTRNLHSKFNSMTDIIPKNAKKIKLMELPEIDYADDDLLTTDPVAKQKSLYHDGFEAYFEQCQTRVRTSKSSMTSAPEISYEEFNKYNKILDLICTEPIKSLNKLYYFQFSQWLFELQEGFNLAFYGIGSKRNLLFKFLQEFVLPLQSNAKCVVINGYNTEFNLRMLMREIWKISFGKPLPLFRETRESCNLTHIEFMKAKNKNNKLYILLHNIDGDSLRNDDLQYMLSQLALISQISLICSLDNLNMPIFWDASVLSNFNFIWHNTSTFQSYFTEVSFKDPLSLGKTDQLVGSRGAKYVLSSLTGNAKNLYKTLILQQLEKIDTYIGDDVKLLDNRGNTKGSIKTCVSLREFYEICVAEFIISNDISFRTILGEFVEHKMCNLARDTSGTEVLFISFIVDEMEKLLDEELMD
ncbi:Origin recognition complex subunit 2 [Pichia californica]|nr:Origin recognition complex subunit 2 [[Candida] californica]